MLEQLAQHATAIPSRKYPFSSNQEHSLIRPVKVPRTPSDMVQQLLESAVTALKSMEQCRPKTVSA